MDDTTGRVDRRENMTGRADEDTRNLERTGSPAPAPDAAARLQKQNTRSATPSRRAPRRDDGLDRQADERTRQLESEIADTREELAETIDAIQHRLRPSTVMSNASDAVKNATREGVRNMAETATETAHDVVRQTRRGAADVAEGARRNPVPALMIGAGVAWLLIDRTRGGDGDHVRPGTRWSSYGTSRYGAGDRFRSRAGGNYVAAGTAVDLDDPDYSDVDERHGSSSDLRHRAGEIGSRAAEATGEARHALRRTTRQAQNGLQRLLRDNPLLVGAAAVVVGAAVGAALPETERENELMGETRDSLLEEAEGKAREAASTAKEVAGNAARTVVSTAKQVAGGDSPETGGRPSSDRS